MNTIIIQGRLTADPEIRTTQNGKKVASFSIAEGDKTNTNFHNCQAWEGRADFIEQYFKKGKSIIVTGKVRTEKWEKDGKQFSKQIVNVNEVTFSLQDKEAVPNEAKVYNEPPSVDEIELEDVEMPF